MSAVAGGFLTRSSWCLARDAVKDTVFAGHSGGTSGDHHSTAVAQKFLFADVIVLSTCMGVKEAGKIVAGDGGGGGGTWQKIQRSVAMAKEKLHRYHKYTEASINAFLEWPYDTAIGRPALVTKGQESTEIILPINTAMNDGAVMNFGSALHLSSSLGPLVSSAAPLVPMAPAVPDVVGMDLVHESSSAMVVEYQPMYAVGSIARLFPDTRPGVHSRHAEGAVAGVKIVDFDTGTGLYYDYSCIGCAASPLGCG